MAETNANQGIQQLVSPTEAALKDRRAEEIKNLVSKFRVFRWILFFVFGFGWFAAFDVVSLITKGSYTFSVSPVIVWVILIFSPIFWYGSHCLKFVRAWEKMVVFRLGDLHPGIKRKTRKRKSEEKKSVRKPGPRWIWYFLDKPVFIRSDQQQIPLPLLSILSGDNIELKIPAFFICRITEPDNFLVKVSKGLEVLTDMVESGIRSEVGAKDFELVKKERDEIANKIKDSLKAQIADWGLELLQIRILDVDVPDDIVEKIQSVLKAKKDKEVIETKANADKYAVMRAAEAAKFEIEARGKANAKAITVAAKALHEDGADNYVAMEIAKAIKTGDKIVIQNLTDLLSLVRPLLKGVQDPQK